MEMLLFAWCSLSFGHFIVQKEDWQFILYFESTCGRVGSSGNISCVTQLRALQCWPYNPIISGTSSLLSKRVKSLPKMDTWICPGEKDVNFIICFLKSGKAGKKIILCVPSFSHVLNWRNHTVAFRLETKLSNLGFALTLNDKTLKHHRDFL